MNLTPPFRGLISAMLGLLLRRANRLTASKINRLAYGSAAHDGHKESEYNEPGGYLFNRVPGQKEPIDGAVKLYIIFYLGGLAAYTFLWQYRPDMSPEAMGKEEALRRMRERGQDPEQYRFKGY